MNLDPSFHVCIFCFKSRGSLPDPKARDCTYGFGHEFEEDTLMAQKPQQKKKDSKSALCIKCNLHPNNPASKSNGCEHEYQA